jgi:hypothetical protein
MMIIRLFFLVAVLFGYCAFAVEPPGVDVPKERQLPPYPPPDPSIYKHQGVMKLNYGGSGVGSFWVYEPINPKPKQAPLIVFIPGWHGVNPINYGAWFEHLVKEGNIVVYVPYTNATGSTPFAKATDNAQMGEQMAIDELIHGQRPDGTPHVRPDFSRFSIAGHSAGGIIAANLAARAVSGNGLPRPQVILSVTPGRMALGFNQEKNGLVTLEDLSVLPADTLLVGVAGDRDNSLSSARSRDVVYVLASASNLPPDHRLLYLVQSLPDERATHFFPSAPDDAYDSGEVAGLAIFQRAPVLKNVNDMISRRLLGKMVLNSLDYELWRLFDEARAVRFDGAQWTMPVIPFTDIHLPSR